MFSAFLFISSAFSTTLPSGYTELEYIENHGNNYIDTGIVPHNSVVKIDFDFQYLNCNSNVSILSIGDDWGLPGNGVRIGVRYDTNPESAYYFYNIETGTNYNTFTLATTTRKRGLWIIDGSAGTSVLTGDLVDSISSAQHFGDNLAWRNTSVKLLNVNSVPDTSFQPSSVRLYRAKIYLDDVLVFDGIPVQNVNQEVGLYDLVSEIFFGYKNIMNNPDYVQLEYIESDGHSCIDTGYKWTSNITQTDIQYYVIGYSSGQNYTTSAFFGAQDDGYSGFIKQRRVNNVYNEAFMCGRTQWIGQHESQMQTWQSLTSKTNSSTTGTLNWNSETSSFSYTNGVVKNVTIALFCTHFREIYTENMNGRIRSFRMRDDGVYVRNFVPAKRKSDNMVGMYDKINNVFYPSITGTDFIAGPVLDITPGPVVCMATPTILNTQMCLLKTQPSGSYLPVKYNNEKYYLMLDTTHDYPIHKDSDNKLKVIVGNTTYNAHDVSVLY